MRYVFGEYILDTRRQELRCGAALIPLRRKAFQLLTYLLLHHDRVVPKEELLEQLWPQQFIGDATLNSCMREVRQAIADNGREQRVIRTMRGRGYRVVATLRVLADDTAQPDVMVSHTPPPIEAPAASPQDMATLPARDAARLCPACQHRNPAAAQFCNACAAPLIVRCLSCKQQNPPEALFCHACAAPLTDNSPPVSEAENTSTPRALPLPNAERRHLTVMFCDLVDATTLAAQLDPEEYREVVRAYQATCAQVIQQYDGHIVPYPGEGVLVYFGYPYAHEDDARRAVQTGLGLLATLDVLNERLQQEKALTLRLRIGIHNGLVVVGAGQDETPQEPLALGVVPNLAFRLQSLAPPDAVVISTAMHHLVQGFFTCDALATYQLSGAGESVGVYRVVQERAVQSRFDVMASRGLPPLVGREAEVTLLSDRWEPVKHGRGQVIILRGEAGIGKSRLAHALKQGASREPHTLWECRSSPYYQHTALYPIRDMLERAWQVTRDLTAAERLARLEQALEQFSPPVAETLPALADLLALSLPMSRSPSLELTPQQRRRKTLETLAALVLELTTRQPVLCIVEDLHWVDPSTVEFLDLLVRQLPTVPLCLVLTCRPAFQVPWSSHSYVTQMTLNPLPPHHVEQMIVQAVGGKILPADVVQQIVAKTDGVPLFVEELTKTILESDLLQEVNGQYVRVEPLASLAIPATLQESLMARLDRLGTAKVVAQQGAVIGRRFSYALLQAILPWEIPTLQRELERLVEAEILYQRGIPPHTTYVFKHALIRDAAYASLLKRTRQQVHARIAQVLEAQFSETTANRPELLAYHYTEAGLYESAVGYWHQAGDEATRRSANREALAHFRQALDLLTTLPNTPEHARHALLLYIALAERLEITEGQAAPDVAQAYSQAYDLCNQLVDPPLLNRVLIGLFVVSLARGQLQQARTLGERFLQRAQRQYDPFLLLMAHRMMGRLLFLAGEHALSRAQYAQGLALYDLRLQPQQQYYDPMFHDAGLFCRMDAALPLWMLGYPAQALSAVRDVLALPREDARPAHLARLVLMAARLHQYCREPSATQEHAEAVIALARAQGFANMLAEGTILRGWALAMQGQQEEGISTLRQGLTAYRATGSEEYVSHFLALLAELHGRVGELQAGLTAVTHAFDLMGHHAERHYEAELYRLKGELLLSLSPDHSPEAETCFARALEVARRQHAKSLELRAAMSLSRLWQQQGRYAAARQLLAPIYNWFTEGFDTVDLHEAKALLKACDA